MDLLSLTFFNLLFFGPLIITILYFFKVIIKIPSFFVIQLFISDICIFLWAFAGIPVLIEQDLFTFYELIIIEELGVIFGSIGFVLFLFSFKHSYSGIIRDILARTGIITFGLLAGVKLGLLLTDNPTTSEYGLYVSNETLMRYTNPIISLIVLIAFISLTAVIFMYSFWQKGFPDYLLASNVKRNSVLSAYLMLAGVTTNYIGLILPIHLLGISNALFFISRFFITFSFIFITLMVAQNPIITLKEKGNTKFLIENGTVGWILALNTDLGPETILKSSQMIDVYNLREKELTLFAVSSIAIVGIGQNFIDNQFIIPFPTKEKELSVLCYSFTMHDRTLTDPRMKNMANIVFGIVIPRSFINYLGNIVPESFSFTETIKNFKDFNELKENINLFEETNKTLRNLILQKIT